MTETLGNQAIAASFSVTDGVLRAESFDNRLTGRTFRLTPTAEAALVISAAVDRVAEPVRIDDFRVVAALDRQDTQAAWRLTSASTGLEAEVHVKLDGQTRTKWVEVTNQGSRDVLLLDIILDDFRIDAPLEGGGQGQPAFVGSELFAAVEHPAGWNTIADGRLTLSHCPGKRLPAGGRLRSRNAILCAASAGQALPTFLSWIRDRSPRTAKGIVSIYTPFGINNQWGACPTLDDEQTLHVLGQVERWQRAGVHLDYFTLDTGWVDRSHDLTRFRPVAYPEGPSRVIDRARELGMRFGLWFGTSWAAESCWDFRPAWGSREPPGFTYRNGYPALSSYTGSFCLAAEPYFQILKSAVLHHIRHSAVRFLKLDGGNYNCDDVSHGHLPGRYAVEHMYDLLIELADAARAEAPDLYILWYWGLRSPFWALHGDMIFESGLFMEGSGTSSTPGLHYRDSVTLAQDQNARNAKTIPPMNKDSLGVWIADTRWGNYLGRERWREALVMDLGRGNLLWPNLWGDLYLLDDEDLRFMAEMQELARRHEGLLKQPRHDLGDPLDGGPYGYAFGNGGSGLVFLNNPSFVSQAIRLAPGELGLSLQADARVRIDSVFPDRALVAASGAPLQLWLRPFEVLLLRISSGGRMARRISQRDLSREGAQRLGIPLTLEGAAARADLRVTFADAARFEALGHEPRAECFRARLPDLQGEEQPILAVAVRLRRAGQEWKYTPVVAEIVQAVARIDGERVTLVPVPDARQFGNTQKAGCSWVVYKTRMPRRWSLKELALEVHSHLPSEVETRIEAWVLRRWWKESARPVGDSYYAEAPS